MFIFVKVFEKRSFSNIFHMLHNIYFIYHDIIVISTMGSITVTSHDRCCEWCHWPPGWLFKMIQFNINKINALRCWHFVLGTLPETGVHFMPGQLCLFVAWWRHQMETFSALLVICAGNSPVTGEFPAQMPVTRIFDVFFDLRLNEGWVNNREAGDLRRRRAHYDVTLMAKYSYLMKENSGHRGYFLNKWINPFLLIYKIWGHSHINLPKSYLDSSTGRTAVSKFKPRVPAKWAVGTHECSHAKAQSNGKSNSQNGLPNQKFDPNSKANLAYRQHHNVETITRFHFQ